jgi:hypothetical protein
VLEKRVHLRGQVEIHAVLAGARRGDRIVRRYGVFGQKRRTGAAGEATRPRELFDPRRPVAEMKTAAGVRCARHQQRIQIVVRGSARPSSQRERVAGIRQARAEDHNALKGGLCAGGNGDGGDGQRGCRHEQRGCP